MSYKQIIAAAAGVISFAAASVPLAASAQSYAATYGPATSMCPSPYDNYYSCPSGIGGLFGAGGWFSGLITPNYYGSQPSYYYQQQYYYYPQPSYPTYSYQYQYQPPASSYYQPSYGYAPQYSYGYESQNSYNYAPQYSYGYAPQYQYASVGNVYYGY